MTFTHTPAPTYTIWGHPDYIDEIAPGWWSVATPSHGGYILSPERIAQIPKAHLDASFCRGGYDGNFEEDCDWCIPVMAFQEEFKAWATRKGEDASKYLDAARKTLDRYIKTKIEEAA